MPNAIVVSLRAERAVRAFRKPLGSIAGWLVTLLEYHATTDLQRVHHVMDACGYDMETATVMLRQLGYLAKPDATRCARCRKELPPKSRAVYEPRTGKAWCTETCLRESRRIATKEG